MKKISKLHAFGTLMVSVFWSCKKDENKIFLEGGTAPVLTSSAITTVPLAFATKETRHTKIKLDKPNIILLQDKFAGCGL